MSRCNCLCTKDATGTCALCEALAERERFIRVWLKGGLFVDCHDRLIARLQDRSKAPGCWLYPVPRAEVRHKDVVREAHKQCSETLNKTMLTLLGVALFCLLATTGSPDKLLLAADSAIKVPFADMSVPFLGFIVVASFLLIALFTYLHIFYHYWLECERERRSINERLIWAPPIESIPTLFSFPDAFSRSLTFVIFYVLVPWTLYVITDKARALPEMGILLTCITGSFFFVLVSVLIRRRIGSSRPQPSDEPVMTVLVDYVVLAFCVGFMVIVILYPERFQRPLKLFRTNLAQAWLPRTNMKNANAVLANFQGANLFRANLQDADLQEANLQDADLRGANLQDADLFKANLQGADLRGEPRYETKLMGAKRPGSPRRPLSATQNICLSH